MSSLQQLKNSVWKSCNCSIVDLCVFVTSLLSAVCYVFKLIMCLMTAVLVAASDLLSEDVFTSL